MSAELAAELELATDAARRAGAIQLERYERLERIVHKGPGDVVTEVDHLCEELILAAIRGRFPDDAIVAEESGAHRARGGTGAHAAEGAERAWIVDPLDGTVNYANGIPVFCVSIGLAVAGRPALGVVYDPVRDELFSAVTGHGATLDGQPIRHPDKERLSDCVISLALPWRGWRRRGGGGRGGGAGGAGPGSGGGRASRALSVVAASPRHHPTVLDLLR